MIPLGYVLGIRNMAPSLVTNIGVETNPETIIFSRCLFDRY